MPIPIRAHPSICEQTHYGMLSHPLALRFSVMPLLALVESVVKVLKGAAQTQSEVLVLKRGGSMD